MAIHHQLPIYKQGYDLLSLAADVMQNMPRAFKASLGSKIHTECVEILVLNSRSNWDVLIASVRQHWEAQPAIVKPQCFRGKRRAIFTVSAGAKGGAT